MPRRETPLAERHREAGAKLIDFAGWSLPLQFSSVAEETQATRRAAALFDISHMGLVRITGPAARAAARLLLTRDATAIPPGHSAYALLCNDCGGVLDDLFAMTESDQAVRLVVNAANHRKDVAWLRERLPSRLAVGVEDCEGRTFGLALQGPRAEAILKAANIAGPLPPAFGLFSPTRVADADVLLSRTGYTGEDGFELLGAAQDGPLVWKALLQAGVDHDLLPAGLAARDVLRQEMGYPLWGQDLDEHTTPLEAGLGWAVDWEGEFIGRAALAGSRPARRRIGFRLEAAGVARAGAIILLFGKPIGKVTSGTYSHNLGAAIGQGYLPASVKAEPGDEIEIVVRGRPLAARVAKLPMLPVNTRNGWAHRQQEEKP